MILYSSNGKVFVMSLKDQLIKLGDQRPELRDHIRPVLNKISSREKEPQRKTANYNLIDVNFDFAVERIIKTIAQYSKNGKVELEIRKGSIQVHIDPIEEAYEVDWEDEVTGSSIERVSLQTHKGVYVQVWFG